ILGLLKEREEEEEEEEASNEGRREGDQPGGQTPGKSARSTDPEPGAGPAAIGAGTHRRPAQSARSADAEPDAGPAALGAGTHRRPAPTPFNRKSLSLSSSLSLTEEPLLRAVAAAYLDRLCRRREPGAERGVMVGGRGVRLARESAVRNEELFVAVALDAGRAGPQAEALVRVASAVERAWLPSGQVRSGRELAWDEARERVAARAVVAYEDLVLDEREVPIDDPDAAARLLGERAAAALPRALALDEPALVALTGRLRFLARARPELELPEPGEELWRSLLPGLCRGLRSFDELRRAPLEAALAGSLTWQQRAALERDAPERLEVPSGSRVRLDYSDPERPVLAARIQELYGLAATPRLAGGRVPVLLHLLAPNGRPQQVTHDLASFWANTYPQVRRELAGRYPKHAWPDDPATARPERRPRRR
ncbi:MAG: hypothetical protein H6Q03_1166, partial [Acidobacteria bacterium]|nr:hypothetical protein [Acidobacteriota bacterium]